MIHHLVLVTYILTCVLYTHKKGKLYDRSCVDIKGGSLTNIDRFIQLFSLFFTMSLRTIVQIFQNLIFLLTIALFIVGLYGYLYRHETNYCGNKILN